MLAADLVQRAPELPAIGWRFARARVAADDHRRVQPDAEHRGEDVIAASNFLRHLEHPRPHFPGVAKQIVIDDVAQDGMADGRRKRVGIKRVTLVKFATLVAPESRRDPLAEQQRRERRVAAAHAFANAHHVRIGPDVVGAPPHAETTETRDDLVEQEQHVVAVADLAYGAPVVFGRPDQLANGGADHRRDSVRALQANRVLELLDAGQVALAAARPTRRTAAGSIAGMDLNEAGRRWTEPGW